MTTKIEVETHWKMASDAMKNADDMAKYYVEMALTSLTQYAFNTQDINVIKTMCTDRLDALCELVEQATSSMKDEKVAQAVELKKKVLADLIAIADSALQASTDTNNYGVIKEQLSIAKKTLSGLVVMVGAKSETELSTIFQAQKNEIAKLQEQLRQGNITEKQRANAVSKITELSTANQELKELLAVEQQQYQALEKENRRLAHFETQNASLKASLKEMAASEAKLRKLNPKALSEQVNKLKDKLATATKELKVESSKNAQLKQEVKAVAGESIVNHGEIKGKTDESLVFSLVEMNTPTKARPNSYEIPTLNLPFKMQIETNKGLAFDVQFSLWGSPIYPPLFTSANEIATEFPPLMNVLASDTFMAILDSGKYASKATKDIFCSIQMYKEIKISTLLELEDLENEYAHNAQLLGVETLWGAVSLNPKEIVNRLAKHDIAEGDAIETWQALTSYTIELFAHIANKLDHGKPKEVVRKLVARSKKVA